MPTQAELDALLSPPEKLKKGSIGGLPVKSVTENVQTFNLMIYGDSGVGKTRLAGSSSEVAEFGKILIVDAEGGTMSLKRMYPNVDTVRVQTWDELQKVYDELYDMKHGYGTVVLDSLTEIQDYSMLQIMKDLKAKGRTGGAEVDIDTPAEREWGINRSQTRKFVRGFRDLPINVIFTSLALEEKDKRTGVVKIKPSLTGKARNEVPGFLDYVFYMYVKNEQRMLLTTTTDKVSAKTRNETMPQTIEDPTMAKLSQLMKEDN